MSIDTITIAGERYVVIPEKEFRQRHDEHGVPILSQEEMTDEDWEEVREYDRAKEEEGIPYEEARKTLGLE